MQQEPATVPEAPPAPPAPPAPAAPAGAQADAAATIVTEGATIGIPMNAHQLLGLRERREILRDQLQRAVNRREELVSQLNETGNLDARTGLQERLSVLDARIIQLERDQATTEQLISSAPPEVLAMARVPDRGPVSGMDDADLFALWAFGLTVGVVLTMIVGRLRRRRQRNRGGTTVAGDARIERLNQAVDAIAEEVERIGEGQRFVTQLLAERGAPELHERNPQSR